MTEHSQKIELAEAIGIRVVNQIVREWWKCRFQEFDARNDDGIDGLIILKKDGVSTGEIIHCQIKSGAGYKNPTVYPKHIGVKLGIKYINKHKPRWNNIVGPVILIYVGELQKNSDIPYAWWVDLKSSAAYSEKAKSIIFVPKNQRLGEQTMGELRKLYGTKHLDYKLQQVNLSRSDIALFNLKENIKIQARRYYTKWANGSKADRSNAKLGEILISRVGWKHLTRENRNTERILQSLQLLGAAKRIIKEVILPESLGHKAFHEANGIGTIQEYLGLRAFVTFPHRYGSVLVVVLKKQSKINMNNGLEIESKIWLYSIYEARRGKNRDIE